MANNVFLFTWEETYLLEKELIRWKENFLQKFGPDSLFEFDVENFESNQVLQAVYGWWLFATKKLIIIKGLPADTLATGKLKGSEIFEDEFLNREWIVPEDTLVVFASYKPDKRTKFFKFIKDNSQVKEFKPLQDFQSKEFIKQQLAPLKIDEKAANYMLLKVWNNLRRLSWESEKIKLRCEANNTDTVNLEIVDNVTYGSVQVDSFKFFDHLFSDVEWSIKIIDDMHEEWVDWNQALWMLYWWIKLYIYIWDLYNSGITDSKRIASITKMHPFAVAKNMKNINKITSYYPGIKRFYKSLVDLDAGIKTWKLPDSYFWLWVKKMVYEFWKLKK